MSIFMQGALAAAALTFVAYYFLGAISYLILAGKTWLAQARRRSAFLKPRELTKRDLFWLGWAPTHRHYKGGLYEEVTRAVATDPIDEGEAVVVYVHETGSTYVRPARLFDEPQRFEELAA